MCSPLKGFILIVPWKETREKWRFRFGLRGVQFVFAVCCTPLRLSPRCVAHRRDYLCGVLHTTETTLWSNISAKSKPNSKILWPVYQGFRWVRIMTKIRGRKSRDTLPLTICWKNVNNPQLFLRKSRTLFSLHVLKIF